MATLAEATMSFGRQLRAGWSNLQPMRKLPIVLASVAVFVTLVVVSYRASSPDYAVLFTNLAESDAGEIANTLRETGVSYRLADEGATILVPKSSVYQNRLDLAAKGLPRGGVVGFEIFDQMSLGQTDFEREVKYRRALEGELVRTITALSSIADARVHVALPEKSAFMREQGRATASVVLFLKPGAPGINQTMVEGIANLVARSVEGLAPEDVAIIDGNGKVLSTSDAAAEAGAGNAILERLQIQRTWEQNLEERILKNLEAIYGTGKVVVMVAAGMDFDVQEETRELYEPAVPGGLVRAHSQEQSSDATPTSIGAAGEAGNAAPMVSAADRFQRNTSTVEYDNNKTVQRRVIAPGQLNSLSVSIVIDGALTAADRDQVRATVATLASGATGARVNPAVSVESALFQSQRNNWASAPAPASPQLADLTLWLIGAGGIFGLMLLAASFVLLRMRRRRQQPQLDITVGETQAAAAVESAVSKEDAERVKRQQEIELLARQQPAEFASLVRNWLSEES